MNHWTRFKQFCFKRRFFFMLLLLLLLLFMMPLHEHFPQLRYIFDLLVMVIFISGINAISAKRSHAVIGTILTMLYIALTGERYLANLIPEEILLVNMIGIIYMLFIIIIILRFIYNAQKVTMDILYGSIVVYLLIGVLFALGYEILATMQEGPFSIPAELSDTLKTRTNYLYLYYSFVTLTTLGYGDISPNNIYGASLSMMEAIIGQIYLVVQVAWLVGMHVSRKSK
jgi:hypothetical protein